MLGNSELVNKLSATAAITDATLRRARKKLGEQAMGGSDPTSAAVSGAYVTGEPLESTLQGIHAKEDQTR